jgi:Skp family chaperone for outer membrane proteins
MKNWATIVIFLAAMAFSAEAQQPVKPQSAIINPAEPISIAPENQVLQSLPGALNSRPALPQADLKKMAEELNEHQRGLIEQHNQQMKQRFTSLQQAGGWQRVFLTQLKLQRLENPNATLQLSAAQQFITNFVFCDHPLIAGQTSEFQTFTNNFRPGTVSKQFAVEPMASIIINGCSFGPDAGEVRLILNHDTGSFLSLQVSDWSDSSIFATLGANPGIADKEAQLVVVRNDGTQSKPMTVQFVQHRMFHVTSFDTAADRSVLEF